MRVSRKIAGGLTLAVWRLIELMI